MKSLFAVALLVCTARPLYAQTSVPPPAGIGGWWPGDGDASDRTGANPGTLAGATFAAGVDGQAFDVSGRFVQIPDAASLRLNAPGPITLEAWVYARSLSGNFQPVSITKEYYYGTLYDGSGQFFRAHFHDGVNFWYHDFPFTLETGRWYHIVTTIDPTQIGAAPSGLSPQPRQEGPALIGEWDKAGEIFNFDGLSSTR